MLSKFGGSVAPSGNSRLHYRDFHNARADERRQALLESLDDPTIDSGYSALQPRLPLGLPFKPMAVSDNWFDWPALLDLFSTSFPGVKTSRDAFLIDTDLDRLRERVADYFDPEMSHEDIARRHPGVMKSTARFDARAVRDTLLKRGGPNEAGFVRHAYRPFDNRWLYWEADTKLLDEKRADYQRHVFEGNLWLGSNKREIDEDFSHGTYIRQLGNWKLGNWGIHFLPIWLRDDGLGVESNDPRRRPNLSPAARRYLDSLGMGVEDLFHHALAVLHDPAYRQANAGALRMEWPRIPLPGWPDLAAPAGRGALSGRGASRSAHSPGRAGSSRTAPTAAQAEQAALTLAALAARGRELARLLDPETPVPGVTTGALRPEIAAIAVPSTIDGRNMSGDDFELTAGWGHFGPGQAVMPGQGRVVQRPYAPAERQALSRAASPSHHPGSPSVIRAEVGTQPRGRRSPPVRPEPAEGRTTQEPAASQVHSATAESALGATTRDIYLNDRAFWSNVPAAVWDYKLGGYQVLKKWLSYRERAVLGRSLTPDEIHHFTTTARRIAAILMLTDEK